MIVSFEACDQCGAITAVATATQATGNSEQHAEWHARINAALTTLAARQDGIPPWKTQAETEDPF